MTIMIIVMISNNSVCINEMKMKIIMAIMKIMKRK